MAGDEESTGELVADAIIAAAKARGVAIDPKRPGELYRELFALGSWLEVFAREGGDVEAVRRARLALEAFTTGKGARDAKGAKRARVVFIAAREGLRLRAADEVGGSPSFEDRTLRALRADLASVDPAFRSLPRDETLAVLRSVQAEDVLRAIRLAMLVGALGEEIVERRDRRAEEKSSKRRWLKSLQSHDIDTELRHFFGG